LIDKHTAVVMASYKATDVANRMVTYEFAKKMAKDIVEDPNRYAKGLENLSPAIRRQVRRAAEKGDLLEVEDLVTNYFMTKTQLIYGQVGMHEFGREMGPIFSMFTTWPVAIASDVFEKFESHGLSKGMSRVTAKYLVPWIAMEEATRAYYGDRPKAGKVELVGPKGFQGNTPVMSALDIGGVTTPKHLVTLGEVAGDIVRNGPDAAVGTRKQKERAREQLKKAGDKLLKTYVPILGHARNAVPKLYRSVPALFGEYPSDMYIRIPGLDERLKIEGGRKRRSR